MNEIGREIPFLISKTGRRSWVKLDALNQMSAPIASINQLAVACATSADATEWEEFLRYCVPVATAVVARVARVWLGTAPRQLVDDIVQEVFLKLCEKERRI